MPWGWLHTKQSRRRQREIDVVSDFTLAKADFPVFQYRQMSLEVASQVGNSDVLRGPNFAEKIFPS
jgi:hypothetical protein